MTKLVILDRDGVINEDSDDFIKHPDEWRPLPGSLEAIALLNHHGFRIAVATNQSGLARGLFDIESLNAIHQKMRAELVRLGAVIDAIFFCPHGPRDACRCRKPNPGLFEAIGERYHIQLQGVPAIGDTLRDLEAARAVGARPILVKTGKGLRTIEAGEGLAGVEIYPDLLRAAQHLVSEGHPKV